MYWTNEAEQLLKKAPDFIRGRLRDVAEKEALRQGVTRIDDRFLEKMQGRQVQTMSPPRKTDAPLSSAFSRKYAVHAGMSGGRSLSGDMSSLLRRELQDSAAAAVSGMAYIHIPFCSSRCLFCGFYAESSVPDTMADYARKLVAEIARSGRQLKDYGHRLAAVYFGGGTPTDMSCKDLETLVQAVRCELPLTTDCEITLEGRLFGFDDRKAQTVLAAGVNRFSFGVQAFDTEIRQRVGRKQSREEVIERLNRIVQLAEPYAAAVIIDLIYGLPGQDESAWVKDIDCAVEETRIHGLDLYQINLIPGTPLEQSRDRLPPVPDIKGQSRLFSAGRRRMREAGFERLSIAHWRRSPVERNRYNSWNKRGRNCMPLGCGAGGRWGNSRFFQQSNLKQYIETVATGGKPLATAIRIPPHYGVTAMAVGQLERQQLDLNALEEKAGKPLALQILPLLRQWEDAGLLRLRQDRQAQLTEAGEFWVVNLQQLIDVKLKEILCVP